jgi:uncharacterized RDD family membrane protein YckC
LAWILDAFIAGVVVAPLNPGLYSRRPGEGFFLTMLIPAVALGLVYLAAFGGGQRGATPGKRIVSIRVADAATGAPIGYRRAAVRRLGYVLGCVVLCAGWLSLLVDARRQA